MFPFFTETAFASQLAGQEYVDMIVPIAMQIAIALGILGAAIGGFIAAILSAIRSKKSIQVSEYNTKEIERLRGRVDEKTEEIKAVQSNRAPRMPGSNTGAEN